MCVDPAPRTVAGMREEPVIEIDDLRKSYGETLAVTASRSRCAVARCSVYSAPTAPGRPLPSRWLLVCASRTPVGSGARARPGVRSDHVRQRVGVQFQHAVLPNMQVREAMAVFAAAYLDPADPDTLLSTWGLRSQRRTAFGSLSGGQNNGCSSRWHCSASPTSWCSTSSPRVSTPLPAATRGPWSRH